MGTFEWANGNRYTGAWARNKPHGRGVKWVRDPEELRLRALAGATVHMIRCEGTWKHGAMHGQGEIEFLRTHTRKPGRGFVGRRRVDQYTACSPKIRCFQGQFCDSHPVRGSLYCGDNDECFPTSCTICTLVRRNMRCGTGRRSRTCPRAARASWCFERGEEHRMVEAQVRKSVPLADMHVLEIRKIVNDELRIAYDMPKNLLLNKVVLRPTMRGTTSAWSNLRFIWTRRRCQAALRGAGPTALRRIRGTGLCMQGHAVLRQGACTLPGMPPWCSRRRWKAWAWSTTLRCCTWCCVCCLPASTRWASRWMLGPPLDRVRWKANIFTSVVDDMLVPQLFVVPDHAQAYPAYVISYKPRVSLVADDTTLQVEVRRMSGDGRWCEGGCGR